MNCRRTAWIALAAAIGISLLSAATARAGGQFVDLAVGGNRVWLVGESGIHELDATTGRIRAMPTLPGAAYPLSVTLADGAAWVGSVENGYVWGTLSRIDARTGKVHVLWRRYQSSVQYVAAGAGSVWALIGITGAMEAARFSPNGHLLQVWKLPRDAGRMAADNSGCWISSNRTLLHIDPSGRLHRALQTPFGDVATGAGAVWVAESTKVIRVDERTGQTRSIPTGTLRLGGFQHDLTATSDALYLLQHSYNAAVSNSRLVRIDLRSGSVTRSARIAGIADAVVASPRAVWVATATSKVSRYDPRTLRRTRVISVP
jgi:hypothetical protein